ncbi:DUF1801 domain-containing protein [Gordonia sp. NPDC057258]|uniref:DUF1801 domain-containing protein n=1 Tax=unclassified Gordonia (in: high G+C Gram-positive bacteria) TaxID=2657482 RepID=UPI0036411180
MGSSGGFSDQERAAMKERAAELEKEKTRGRGNKKAAEELDLLAKLESMDPADRALAERIHAIVTTTAPDLAPKLWYGQPAYALKGKVVCFFRSGHDDKERFSTLGFTQNASLDDGGFWPTSFAVSTLDTEAEKTIATLVAKAVS